MFTGGAAFLSEIIHSIRPGMNKSVLAVIFGTIWAAAAASVTYIATRYGFAVWWWTALAWVKRAPSTRYWRDEKTDARSSLEHFYFS
jgi:hypothetical protein